MAIESDLNFVNVNLCSRSFAGQDLTGATFRDADLRGVDFTKAALKNATFTGCRTGISKKQKLVAPIVALLALLVMLPIGILCGDIVLDPHRLVTVYSNDFGITFGFFVGAIVVIGGLIGFGAEKITQIHGLIMAGVSGAAVGGGLGVLGVAVFYLVQAVVQKDGLRIFSAALGVLLAVGLSGLALYCGFVLYRDLTGTDFGEADLTGAHFSLMRLQNCNFLGAKLDGVDWADCEFKSCDFKDGNSKPVSQSPSPESVPDQPSDDSQPRSPE